MANESPLAIGAAAAASSVGVGASTYVTAGDIAKEEFPNATLEELRSKDKNTQKKWRDEADRRRGVRTGKERQFEPAPVFVPKYTVPAGR